MKKSFITLRPGVNFFSPVTRSEASIEMVPREYCRGGPVRGRVVPQLQQRLYPTVERVCTWSDDDVGPDEW